MRNTKLGAKLGVAKLGGRSETARRVSAVSLFGAVLLAFIFWRYWGSTDVTWGAFFSATVVGLTVGSLYAMYATGLVVVYTTTGIFNFAQGAIGVFSAFLYWELHVNRGWHSLLAIFVVVILFAPVLGVVLDILIMRKLRSTPLVVQLMATVALMILLLSLTSEIWNQDTSRRIVHFFGLGSSVKVLGVNILWHRIITVIAAIVLALVFSLVLFKSKAGVAMRAVVDNRSLAALNGVRPGLVSASAWAIGSSLAALGGILIAPELEFDPANMNIIVITAFAAAVFGALRNLPLTIIGALLIGLLESHVRTWTNFGTDFRFVSMAVAPVVLFVVVLALPRAKLAAGRIVTNLKQRERTTHPVEAIFGATILVFLTWVLLKGWLNFGIWDPGEWGSTSLLRANSAISLGLIGLSLVPLTGWAGQINFAPLAFAGFGAWLYLELAGGGDVTNGYWIPLVALLAAPVGALVAVPASRLRGLYLALASMAFAHGMSLLFFPHSSIIPGTQGGVLFGDISLFGITFSERESFLMLMMCIFACIVVGLVCLRWTRYGRRWVALNDSHAAAATVGVNVNLTKVAAYALSASIAAIGGVIWATAQVNPDGVRSFVLESNLEIVLLIAAAGISIPMAGIFLTFRAVFEGLSERLEDLGNVDFLVTVLDKLVTFGPGLLALGMVVNPRGAIYEMGRGFAPILPWRRDARQELARERAQKRDVEFGELGISQPFTADEVMTLERRLRINDRLTARTNDQSNGQEQ